MASSLPSWLASFFMAFSGQAVITFAAVRMLKSTRPGIIWAIAVIGCTVTAYINAFGVSGDLQSLWTAVNLIICIVTYVVFSKLRPLRALFIVACIMLITLLAELLVVMAALYGLDINITAGPSFAFEHPAVYFFLLVFHALVLAILLHIAFVLTRRLITGEGESRLARTLAFPISQSALLLMAMIIVRALASQNERSLAYGALLAIAVLCSYLVFYIAAKKMRSSELSEMRVDLAKEQGACVYEQTRHLVQESQRIAKIRHDFRNQVRVIELLCEQGEISKAHTMTAELLAKVEQERVR